MNIFGFSSPCKFAGHLSDNTMNKTPFFMSKYIHIITNTVLLSNELTFNTPTNNYYWGQYNIPNKCLVLILYFNMQCYDDIHVIFWSKPTDLYTGFIKEKSTNWQCMYVYLELLQIIIKVYTICRQFQLCYKHKKKMNTVRVVKWSYIAQNC